MFLTRKSRKKILLMAVLYFALGSSCILLAWLFNNLGVGGNFLRVLGIITYALGVLVVFWGRYAEGKGKLLNLGIKLVRKELKPAEFIQQYDALKNDETLVVNKPSFEVLQLVAVAYDLLDDGENALAVADEMISVASEKRKTFARLFKTSILFSYGKVEEAEALFDEARNGKLDLICTGMVDSILKSDRAMAMGDYKTVETYNLNLLQRTLPALDNAGKLVVHYQLGTVYENWGDREKMVEHYQYCANNGGETAQKELAAKKLQNLSGLS